MTSGGAVYREINVKRVCGLLLLMCFLALVPLQQAIDQALQAQSRSVETLYIPSGNMLRRLSLGHEGLLADIYWTRVVQYFGRKRLDRATQFKLLGPLLRITTDLDPQLVIAYRFGAVFLAEKAPGGAGQPQEALQLLRRGIVANPDYWRLWQDLGFIYYWDLKDYASAARVFQTGAKRPGAGVWMKALAATVAARGERYRRCACSGQKSTARLRAIRSARVRWTICWRSRRRRRWSNSIACCCNTGKGKATRLTRFVNSSPPGSSRHYREILLVRPTAC